jgi:hypothetical protein
MAREAVDLAVELIDNWEQGTRTRFDTIREYEENQLGKVRPRTSGRSNFAVPVMARYMDEIHSRLDETPHLKFDSEVSMSRKLIAQKVTAIIKDLKKPSKGNWNRFDRLSKTFAGNAGYNIVDFYSEEIDGQFYLRFEPLHHTEAVFQIGGGPDLEQHVGVGKFPLWRSKSELTSRAKSGFYAKDQVDKLVKASSESTYMKHNQFFANKTDHLKALGIDISNHAFAGQPTFPLAQMQLTMDFGNGPERWVLTFDYWSKIWVRFKPLKEVFPSGMYSMDLWQTSDDVDVMCKSVCDDIFPFAEGIRVKVNQLFDNHTRRIYGQTVYDPKFFPNPAELIWKAQDQLVRGRSYGGKPISQGFAQIKTEDMTESTIGFIKYMDDFLASSTGISPNDVTDVQQKVAVMFGQLAKTASRLGGRNKSYNEMWQRNGFRALHELKAFLKEKQAIQIIGTKGTEWTSFIGSELEDPADFDILAEGSNVELEMSEARKKAQGEALDMIIQDQDLKKETNPRATVEFILKGKGQFSETETARIMDKTNYGNEDMIARADLACEEIIKHKYKLGDLPKNDKKIPIWSSKLEPKLYNGADIAFMQYILDYANKLEEEEHEDKIALMAYGRAHKKIVVRNMAQKGVGELAKKGIAPNQVKAPLPPGMGGGQGQQGPPQPPPAGMNPQPSPAMAQKVKQRGARPLGHMPVQHAKSMLPKMKQRMPSKGGAKKRAPAPVAAA